jgi:hypothetical protein
MNSSERWKTDTRYRVVAGITLGFLPALQTLLSITSRTAALLLISQMGLKPSFPWFLSCLLMFILPSVITLITDGVPAIIQPISIPPVKQMFFHLILNALHCIGLILLTFFALPSLSFLQSTCLMGTLCVAPSFIHLLKLNKKGISTKVKVTDLLCSLVSFHGHWYFRQTIFGLYLLVSS